MAGSSSNWFKLSEGPLKGQRVFISNAALQGLINKNPEHYKGTGAGTPQELKAKYHANLAKGFGPTNTVVKALAKKSAQPGGQAKSGGALGTQSRLSLGEQAPPEERRRREDDPYQKPIPGGIAQKIVGDGPARYTNLTTGQTASDAQAGNRRTDLIFDKTGVLLGPTVNGVELKSAPVDSWRQHRDVDVGEPPLPELPTVKTYDKELKRMVDKPMKQSTGVFIQEPDGRIWLYEPSNHFGGYYHTFPKGRLEPGLTPQQNARKEAREEMGLDVEITGFVGDAKGDVTMTRYYLARRIGGAPWDAHHEADNVKLVTPDTAFKLLNKSRDRKLFSKYLKSLKRQQQQAG